MGKLFLRIVRFVEFVPDGKTPGGRILSGNGTTILSTINSNLKTYQNCKNCKITTHNPFRKFEKTSWREVRSCVCACTCVCTQSYVRVIKTVPDRVLWLLRFDTSHAAEEAVAQVPPPLFLFFLFFYRPLAPVLWHVEGSRGGRDAGICFLFFYVSFFTDLEKKACTLDRRMQPRRPWHRYMRPFFF